MSHNIIKHLDEEYMEFVSSLNKLSKEEIIDTVSDFWYRVREQGKVQYEDEETYCSKVTGGIKLTMMNLLKNMVYLKGTKV